MRFPSEGTFREAFMAFIAGLQVDWNIGSCPVCLDAPRIMVCDGTAARIKQRLYNGAAINTPHPGLEVMVLPGHRRAERQFADTGQCTTLKLLARFIHGKTRAGFRGADVEVQADWLAVDGAGALLSTCSGVVSLKGSWRTVSAHLAGAFLQLGHWAAGGALTNGERTSVARAISSMASNSAVSSYLPHEACAVLKAACEERAVMLSPQQADVVAHFAPLVHSVLLVCRRLEANFSLQRGPWEALVSRLVAKAELCHGAAPGAQLPPAAELEAASAAGVACFSSGVCCGHGRVRHRVPCAADNKSRDSTTRSECREPVGDACRHSFDAGGGRTGGIFTWFCEHGVCYAFHIIPRAEGRNEAYSFLTGFLRVAPKVVIYDFACALEEYCLNRAPEFFKSTRFVVDRFHWSNHTACSWGYCMVLYRDLAQVNSQWAEQCNAALKRVRSALSRMRMGSFMAFTRLFLHTWNVRRIEEAASLVAAVQQFRQMLE